MYAIKTHKSVDKFLAKHPELGRRFVQSFELIAHDPYTTLVDTKPMIGKQGHYRLRIGKYRFLYEIREQEILIWIWKADSRGSVYR